MTHHLLTRFLLAAGTLATVAHAQPSIVSLGMGVSDLSADGNTVAGTFYDAAAPGGNPVCTWTKGVGLRRTGGIQRNAQIRASDDANALSYADYNFQNFGNLSYGTPDGYARTSLTYRWTPATGPVNCGLAANGNRCDFTINTPYDISGNPSAGSATTPSPAPTCNCRSPSRPRPPRRPPPPFAPTPSTSMVA